MSLTAWQLVRPLYPQGYWHLYDRHTIYFHDLTGCYANELKSALSELTEQLHVHYSELPRIAVQPLGCEDTSTILEQLVGLLPGRSCHEETTAGPLASKRLFLLCEERDPFVATARIENPRAHWGIAIPRQFAVAWVDNKYLWWHEALHLFNAKDCYNKFGINKCREANCVMQASPTHYSCGGRLHLCSKNVRRLKDELRDLS